MDLLKMAHAPGTSAELTSYKNMDLRRRLHLFEMTMSEVMGECGWETLGEDVGKVMEMMRR